MQKLLGKLVSIKSRLIFLVVVALLGMLVASAIGGLGIISVSGTVKETNEQHLPAMRDAEALRGVITQALLANFQSLSWTGEYDLPDRLKLLVERKAKISAELKAAMDRYGQLPKTPGVEKAWQQFNTAMKEWLAQEGRINEKFQVASTSDPDGGMMAQMFEVKAYITGMQLDLQKGVDKALDALVSEAGKSANAAQKSAYAKSAAAQSSAVVAVLVVGALLIFLSWIIVRSIVTPLNAMRESIVSVASNKDFTLRTPSRSDDETGQTVRAFNKLLEEIQHSIRGVLQSAEQIGSVAQDAAAASAHVAGSSHSQSEASAEMAAAVEEMTVSIQNVTESSHAALGRAKMAGEDASASATIIEQGSEGMGVISHTVREAGETIDALGQQSQQINGIMAVIKDVADQTNLLALNAAIEAARAGESGRGFAVVADEVRKLAERTAKSTQEINVMVTSMQESTRKAVERMKTVVTQVDEGKSLSNQASGRMLGIRDSAKSVAGAVQDIADSLTEQNLAAQQIAGQIEKVARMTDANSAAAQETAAVADNLEKLAASLKAAMAQFRV